MMGTKNNEFKKALIVTLGVFLFGTVVLLSVPNIDSKLVKSGKSFIIGNASYKCEKLNELKGGE